MSASHLPYDSVRKFCNLTELFQRNIRVSKHKNTLAVPSLVVVAAMGAAASWNIIRTKQGFFFTSTDVYPVVLIVVICLETNCSSGLSSTTKVPIINCSILRFNAFLKKL